MGVSAGDGSGANNLRRFTAFQTFGLEPAGESAETGGGGRSRCLEPVASGCSADAAGGGTVGRLLIENGGSFVFDLDTAL